MVLNPGSSSRHEIPVIRQRSGAVLEAPALVAGLDDVAVMGEAIEQRRGHLGIAEHARPFAEGEIGGDQDRGALVEPADEVKEKLAARLGKRQVAELVEDDEVHAAEIIGDAALAPGARLGLELVDEIDGGEEAPAPSGADAASRNGDHGVRLAGAGSADEHGVALLGDEAAAGEVANKGSGAEAGYAISLCVFLMVGACCRPDFWASCSACSRAWRSLARASIFARASASLRKRYSRRASSSGIDMPSGMSAASAASALAIRSATSAFNCASILSACSSDNALCRLALAWIFVPSSATVPIFRTPISRASSST